MYTEELHKLLLPYIDIACQSCRISRQIRKDWSRTGDLEMIVERYKSRINYEMMVNEVLVKYREAING